MGNNIKALLYITCLIVYIGLLIKGKNREKNWGKKYFKCMKYALIPYKTDCKMLIFFEIMNIFFAICLGMNYQVSAWVRFIIAAIGYFFGTIMISLSNVLIIHIAEICQNLENKEKYEYVTAACVMPIILLISTKEYSAIDGNLFNEWMPIISLVAFVINYFVLEKILIDFIRTGKKVLGTFPLSDIVFQMIIQILNLLSGAYILIKMYSNQLDFYGNGWELLYEVAVGFLTFDYSFVTADGLLGKSYVLFFIVSYIIIFMVYMNFVIDIIPKIETSTKNENLKDENTQKNERLKSIKKKHKKGKNDTERYYNRRDIIMIFYYDK